MAITFSNIGVEESSTVTSAVAAVTIARGSTNEKQELLCLADPQSSLGIARVLAAVPGSTEFGLVVRVADPSTGPIAVSSIAGVSVIRPEAGSTFATRPLQSSAGDLQMTATPLAGSTWNVRPLQSSAADLQMTATPVAGSTWNVRPLQSSAADLQMTATPVAGSTWNTRPLQSSAADLQMTATIGGNLQSSVAAAQGSSGLLVREVYPTLLSTTVLITSSHSTAVYELISSGASTRHWVYAYFVGSTHTNPSTLVFMSSLAIDRWHVNFGSGSSGMTGANMAVGAPASLFHTNVNEALNVRIEGGSSVTSTVIARISLGYFSLT